MKKTLQTLLSLVVVAASLVSCAKETFKENSIPSGEMIQVAVSGSIGEFVPADATKANAESVVRVTWTENDQVYVYDGSACLGPLTVAPNEDNASHALLSGTIKASAVSPAPSKLSLVYVKGAETAPAINDGKISVDIGSQSGAAVADVTFVLYATIKYDEEKLTKDKEFVPFTFATSVMTVNCTNLPVDAQNAKINITKAEIIGVSTACELTIDGTGVTAVSGTTPGTITRKAGFEQADSRGSFKIGLAADPATPEARHIIVYQDNKASGAAFTSATLAGGKSYNTVYQLNEYLVPPKEMLPGVFTVADPDGIANSGDETKVHFSPGNLQATYTGSEYTWDFAANQYDFIGNAKGNSSIDNQDNGNVVDLFGWSTKSTNYGISTSCDNADYSGDFEDWGKAYCKSKSIVEGTWRTLSTEEWQYLFNYDGETTIRTDKCKGATVNGVAGYVIAPDDFTGTIEDSYDDAALAANNLVFLPAAGYRDGSEIVEVSEYGYYWSSSPAEDDAECACGLYFGSDWSDAWWVDSRLFGCSVRLVTESSGGYAPAVKVTGVTLSESKITINHISYSKDLVATVAPVNATNKRIVWSSSDETVATVEQNGCVVARNMGSAVITATTVDGNFTAFCLVEIEPVKVTGVTLNKNETTIIVGAKETLVATVAPADATNKQVIWSSSKPSVATVNTNGEVTGVAAGSAVITATTADGNFTAVCLATVLTRPAGALAGEFRVSDTKKVHFSQGNMYWDGDSFEFEDNQYDTQSSWSISHVSHFFWSKDASVAYAETYSDDGSTKTDVFFTNTTETTAKSDFIVNGMTGMYRTLSLAEWQYLFNTRTVNGGSGEGKSYQRATINSDATGVYGMILYPDEYTSQTSATSYTTTEWTTMEAAGCVFLPAAGYRSGSSVSYAGERGFYWLSTAYGKEYKYYIFFRNSAVQPATDYPSTGDSVRLITECQ